MNDLMNQLLDQFEAGLMDRTLKVMTIVTDETRRFPMELNKSQCSEIREHLMSGLIVTRIFLESRGDVRNTHGMQSLSGITKIGNVRL